MTVICFASVKGSPGVTTTACLVGASWRPDRPVIVAECDAAGGDLAARFSLSSSSGWPSYGSAVRRADSAVSLRPHLQQLPGGLDVLAGTRGPAGGEMDHWFDTLVQSASSANDGSADLVVDLGRLSVEAAGLVVCTPDVVVIVLRGDAASVVKVAARSSELIDRWGDRLGLVVVGPGGHPVADVEAFVGIPVIGELPFDPEAAAVASGQGARGRRLRRSSLAKAAARLAESLADEDADSPTSGIGADPAAQSAIR